MGDSSKAKPCKVTTRELFRTIGNTERTRSAKADVVFRQLRKEFRQTKSDSKTMPSNTRHNISTMMKIASRQPI